MEAHMNKKETITRTLIVIVCLSLMAIIVCSIILLYPVIVTNNLKSFNTIRMDGEYREYLNTVSSNGKYCSFPRTTINVRTINEYIVSANKGDIFSALLDVTYDEKGLENEIARLNNLMVKSVSRGEEAGTQYKKLAYINDGSLFQYPTYVALYDESKVEYVCVDYSNNRCVYVYIGDLSKNELNIDKVFLPINHNNTEISSEFSGFKYSIYDD